VASDNSDFRMKAVKMEVEGIGGDGIVTNWIHNWIRTTRLSKGLHKGNQGIAIDDFYQDFQRENLQQTPEGGGTWDLKRFDKAIWSFVDNMDGYEYNDHRRSKGKSKSDRRVQLKKTDGSVQPHICITTKNDKDWLKELETSLRQKPTSGDFDAEQFFREKNK